MSYPHRRLISTRWADNDVYGHVNNVEYYAFFDTVINAYLIEQGGLDIRTGAVIGLCAESHCTYHAPLAFPDAVVGALRVGKLGRTSVRYELALFREGSEEPAAEGWFVHVFVDRETRRPAAIEGRLREVLQALAVRPLGGLNVNCAGKGVGQIGSAGVRRGVRGVCSAISNELEAPPEQARRQAGGPI